MNVRVDIVYPNDPLGPKVGGPETFLKGFIKYAPKDFQIRFLGVSTDPVRRPPRQWRRLVTGGREFDFYPVFLEADENRKEWIPISFRFAIDLFWRKPDCRGRVLLFDRLEPALAYLGMRSPKVGVVHNDIAQWLKKGTSEVLWNRIPAVYFAMEKRVIASLDLVYSVSEKTLALYRSKYPKAKSRLGFLPTWVDPEVFSPANFEKKEMRTRLRAAHPGLPESMKWVLFVGRLQEQKAPLRLIETFHAFHKVEPSSILVLIAEGNLKNMTQNRVRELGLDSSVFFLGNKSQEALADFYRASDALLLTSNFEGMPRCVLEALGSGLPVVTTRVGEVALVVKNGISGRIVESFDPQDLAAALVEVLTDTSTYSVRACLDSVSAYQPKKVLGPLYEKMRMLQEKK